MALLAACEMMADLGPAHQEGEEMASGWREWLADGYVAWVHLVGTPLDDSWCDYSYEYDICDDGRASICRMEIWGDLGGEQSCGGKSNPSAWQGDQTFPVAQRTGGAPSELHLRVTQGVVCEEERASCRHGTVWEDADVIFDLTLPLDTTDLLYDPFPYLAMYVRCDFETGHCEQMR
jgi:hypothetical protein